VRLEDPDIIAFQEVRHDSERDSQPSKLAALLPGYMFVWVAAMSYPEHTWHRVEEGCAVFSKYPLGAIGYELLPKNPKDRGDVHQRALLHVESQVPGMGSFNTLVCVGLP
jgi:endonuclease/exonuclease/phosphatase family metal-dependent hydrolase